jgi:hypothetical protein
MKSAFLVFGMIAAISWDMPGLAAERQLPLRVVYLGNENTPRATAFVQFLRTRFEQVAERNRDDLDLESVRAFDVVLLDWSQQDTDSEKAVSPLGPRARWTKPTVLVGSAGHLLATPWETVGAVG